MRPARKQEVVVVAFLCHAPNILVGNFKGRGVFLLQIRLSFPAILELVPVLLAVASIAVELRHSRRPVAPGVTLCGPFPTFALLAPLTSS